MRIALGQLASGTDTLENLDRIDDQAARAAAEGARLVVFPEYATYEKKVVDSTFPEVAESLDGQTCTALGEIARRHEISLVAGVVETSDQANRAYNTLIALDTGGRRIAEYRKIHLFDAQDFHESDFIRPSPSTAPVVFSIDGIRFGLMACYDLRFPEAARSLSDAGSDVVLVCSSWVPGEHKTRQWQTLLAARAIENGTYVIGVSQAAPVSVGHSLAADPMGTVVSELGEEPDVGYANLAPEAVIRAQEEFPTHLQRRIL